MIKVRKNVFETNSSSTHSISISAKEPNPDTLKIDYDGRVRIRDDDFGWEYEEYNDATSKASYCWTWVKEYGQSHHLEMLRQAIATYLVISEAFVVFNDMGGYIDHQSSDVAEEYFSDVKKLQDFIFNKNYILITDNDNH